MSSLKKVDSLLSGLRSLGSTTQQRRTVTVDLRVHERLKNEKVEDPIRGLKVRSIHGVDVRSIVLLQFYF